MQGAQFDRSADEIATDSFSPNPGVRPVPRGIVEEAEAAAPPPTAQDHASPLPTDLIQRGKQRMAGAAASGTANRILQDNGAPPVGTAVEIYIGGDMKKGTVADAFVADDPQLGKSPGIKIKLEDGSIFEEHFADLTDANVSIIPAAGNQDDSKPPKPEHVGRTKEDATARPTPNFDRMVAVTLSSESGGRDTDANGNILTSPAGAQGKMQVMPGTNRDPGFGVRPAADDSPEERARVGRDYLAAMMRRYGNDPAKAWAAYNAGPGAVDKALGAGGDWLAHLPGETQAYVRTNLRKVGSDTGALASTISQEPIEPDTGWIDDIMREDTSAADAQVQAIAQGRDPLGLDQPEVISVRAGDIRPFAIHEAGAGTDLDPARAAENEQLRQSISAEGVREPLKLDIDQDRGTARLGNGNHRAVIANDINPDMMIPVEIRRLSGLKRGLTSARPYSGEFDSRDLVGHHGTARQFDTLRPSRGEFGTGIYFSSDKGEAQKLADVAEGDSPRVISAKLDIKNPIRFTENGPNPAAQIARTLGVSASEIAAADKAGTLPDLVRQAAIAKGHDGIIVSSKGAADNYIAFHPSQVGATGNGKRELNFVDLKTGQLIGDGTRAAPIDATTAEHVEAAGANVNTAPTDAQIEAGNYAKGHVRVHGLDITIENPKGSERSGTDPDGKPWSVTMPATYGYLKRTEGQDGEHVDVYVGEHPTAPHVFVVDQVDLATKKPDEHKVMLGFDSQEAAISAYHDAFSDGKGVERIGAVTPMSVEAFKTWLKDGDTTAPAAGQLQTDNGASAAAPGFDADAWNRGRNEAIKASKAAGNTHLDQVDASVETMRGKEFYNVHDPKERGVVRTVANTGDVVVHWADDYSAQKNLAEAKTEGKRTVHESWLMPSDLKDYVFARGKAGVSKAVTPATEGTKDAGFDPLQHVPAMRKLIADRSKSLRLDKVAASLGIELDQARAVAGHIASRPDGGIALSKNGNIRRIVPRTGPVSLLQFLKDRGGIQPTPRHNLTSNLTVTGADGRQKKSSNIGSRGLHLTYPGLINGSGMDFDTAFETAAEAGYFGPRDMSELTESDFLDALENARDHYRPEDVADVKAAKAMTRGHEDERTAARGQLDEALKDPALKAMLPSLISETDKGGIVDLMLSDDPTTKDDPYSAATEHFARQAAQVADDAFAITKDPVYDIPFSHEEAAGQEAPRQAGEGYAERGNRRSPASGDTGQGEKARAGAGKDGGQLDAFGERPEDKRVSLEHKGEGRLQSDKQQKSPGSDGGLFDSRDTTGTLDLGAKHPLGSHNEDAARSGGDARIQNLEGHQKALLQSERDRLSEIRRGGSDAGAGVDERLSGVSGGDRAATDTTAYGGPDQGGEGLRAGERPLGDQAGAGSEPGGAQQSTSDLSRQNEDRLGMGANAQALGNNGDRAAQSGRDGGGGSKQGERQSQPSDLSGGDANAQPVGGENGVGSAGANKSTQQGMASGTGADGAAKAITPIGQARAALQTAMEALDAAESRKPEPGKMIEDAGEKIGGARKDQWAQRGMSVADLEGMTHGEAHQLVTKDAVWPKPDYAAMVESGVPADVAAGIKLLRDSLTATPSEDSEQGRRDFIEQMAIARQVAESSRTMDDINQSSSRLQKASPDMPDAMSMRHQWNEANIAARRRYFTIFRGRTARFRADPRKIREMIAQGFPAKAEPWTRRYDVRKSYGRGGAEGVWFVTPKGKRTIAADNFATKEEAEAAAKALYEGEDRTREKKPDRPHLDKIERTGADVRGGRDIDSADFLKDFGFRGVEFGNWVASDERQKATNLAYEALHDLADTLRIPPRALSLNDQLGLAFGSRGGGRFAAHYEPGKLVINLTKLSGAGSLAHEWGHALDHYFGTLDTDLGTRGAPKGASGWYDRTESRLMALGNLRPEMASAFDGLMKAIFKRDLTRAEMVRNVEQRIEKLKAGIERQKAEVEKSTNATFTRQSKAWIAQQESALLAAGRRLADLTDEKKPITASQVESSFYKEAQKLSGKSGSSGYWARPTEMLARSFESYVFDKIAARGEKSQYLVQGVEPDRYASETYKGNPYPTGEERQAINAAYDDLFHTMQVREEPTGERPLFSRVEPTETPEFKRWFGDSKVVDESGAPLVVYHGTGAQFDAFSKDAEPMNYETDRGLFHFTTDRKEAESYSKHGGAFGEIENKNPRVISAYVSLQNPFVIDNSDSPTEDWDRNGDTYLDEAKRTGRDGIIIQTEDGKNKLVIAFEPTQIKSTANRGTFDPNDDRIMYSRLDGERSAPFFSKLERVVEESQTTRAPASQWTATLAKAGVKKEELEWTGVFDWLDMQEGPVEKAALLGVIRDGGIKVEEVVLGENRAPTQREIEARADEAFERDLNEALADAEDESDEEGDSRPLQRRI
jgi:hypothetical protein